MTFQDHRHIYHSIRPAAYVNNATLAPASRPKNHAFTTRALTDTAPCAPPTSPLPMAAAGGQGRATERALFPLCSNRHTFPSVRVIVSPVLTATFVSTGLNDSSSKGGAKMSYPTISLSGRTIHKLDAQRFIDSLVHRCLECNALLPILADENSYVHCENCPTSYDLIKHRLAMPSTRRVIAKPLPDGRIMRRYVETQGQLCLFGGIE